jgi:hypothetical protein
LSFRPRQRRALLAAAVLAGSVLTVPDAALAEGLFDFLFGAIKQQARQAAPSPQANFFADPFGTQQSASTPAPRVAGSGPAFCVRSCDGKYFAVTARGNATPAQMCQAFCPASPTKVYFGSNIDYATSANGERYANSENAFAYRKALRADCTCNGKDPGGLAPIDISLDGSLRPGDVLATASGRLFRRPRRQRPDRGVHANLVLSGTDRRGARAPQRNEGRTRHRRSERGSAAARSARQSAVGRFGAEGHRAAEGEARGVELIQDPHGEERHLARPRTMLCIAGRTMRPRSCHSSFRDGADAPPQDEG